MSMDIRSTVLTLGILGAIGALWMLVSAAKRFRRGKRIPFFFKRRKAFEQAASLSAAALALAFFAFASFRWVKGWLPLLPPTLTPAHAYHLHPHHHAHPQHNANPDDYQYASITNTPLSSGCFGKIRFHYHA